ncbi:MAG: GerMN domain-containing protein [Patescibacteria group bacterium]
MTEEEKIQSALPLDNQSDNQGSSALPVADVIVSTEEAVLPEAKAEAEGAEEAITEESKGLTETLETEVSSDAESGAPIIETENQPESPDSPEMTEVVIPSEQVKKDEEPKSDRPQPKTIIAAVVALLIVVAVVWLIVSSMNQDKTVDGDGTVKVSTALENGKVSIIEEVPDEIQVNVTSDDVPVWPKIKIIAYYGNTVSNPNSNDCSKVEPLEREVDDKFDSNIVNTVIGLLQPLSSTDKAAGYYSAIPLGTRLKYVKIDDDGTLEVNFDSQLDKAAGSCAVTAIRAQITNTLMQFAQIQSVRICIDSNCQQDQILQP